MRLKLTNFYFQSNALLTKPLHATYFMINLQESMGPGLDQTDNPWISNQIHLQSGLYIQRQNWSCLAPWQSSFSMDKNNLSSLDRWSYIENLTKLFLNLPIRFILILQHIHRKNWPHPLANMFFQLIKLILAILEEGHPQDHLYHITCIFKYMYKIFKVSPFGW